MRVHRVSRLHSATTLGILRRRVRQVHLAHQFHRAQPRPIHQARPQAGHHAAQVRVATLGLMCRSIVQVVSLVVAVGVTLVNVPVHRHQSALVAMGSVTVVGRMVALRVATMMVPNVSVAVVVVTAVGLVDGATSKLMHQ